MKEAKIAFWENGEWKPREDCVFPDYIQIEDLPRPRFFPGQKIKFRWTEGHKEAAGNPRACPGEECRHYFLLQFFSTFQELFEFILPKRAGKNNPLREEENYFEK